MVLAVHAVKSVTECEFIQMIIQIYHGFLLPCFKNCHSHVFRGTICHWNCLVGGHNIHGWNRNELNNAKLPMWYSMRVARSGRVGWSFLWTQKENISSCFLIFETRHDLSLLDCENLCQQYVHFACFHFACFQT